MIPGIESVIDPVKKTNSDLLAFTILILTDAEHIPQDEKYLGGVVRNRGGTWKLSLVKSLHR